MILYSDLLKKSRAFRLFAGDLERGTLNHCYLLESPDEAALFELVKLMACALHCRSEAGDRPCLVCPDCRRYETLSGGNALVYPKEDRIRKDDVEDLLRNINYKAFEHGSNVAVLKRADRMDAAIQNKLLKTLEEPPENVVFFLLAANADKLLPTVRSRARTLELEPFSEAELEAELLPRLGRSEKLSDACAAAGGCVGIAERYFRDSDFERLLGFSTELLVGLRTRQDFVKFSGRFDEIKANYELVLDFLQMELRDALLASEGVRTPPLLPGQSAKLSPLFTLRSDRIAEAVDYINECKRKIVSNCNAAAAFDMLLVALLRMKEEQ